MGSFLGWLILALAIFFVARRGVGSYRRTIYECYKNSRVYRAVRGSKLYNVHPLFRPGV